MWLQLSQILKKSSPKETRENQHLFITLMSQKAENTRGTRVVIHLSTRSYDAMYSVREGKSKLEPFTGYLESFYAKFFWPKA